jgi:hypothetical protein
MRVLSQEQMLTTRRERSHEMSTRIYLARAIDGRSASSICEPVRRAERDLRPPRFDVVDPVTECELQDRQENTTGIVASELQLLQSCDVILADMSIPNHAYIGCIAELVYAHLWNLTIVVYIGTNSALRGRPWLIFHSHHIDITWEGAIKWIKMRQQL